MAEFTVTDVFKGDSFSTQHGQFQPYFLTLEGRERKVQINQKPETAPPAEGQTLDLIITDCPERKTDKAKKAQTPGAAPGGGKPGGGKYEADPKKLAAENRRSALHAAISLSDKVGAEITRSADVLTVAESFRKWIEQDA